MSSEGKNHAKIYFCYVQYRSDIRTLLCDCSFIIEPSSPDLFGCWRS